MNHCDVCNQNYATARSLAAHKLTNKHLFNEVRLDDFENELEYEYEEDAYDMYKFYIEPTEEEKTRKDVLINELAKYKLVLRSDSKLCESYINGSIHERWTLDTIAYRMCQMRYLYDYCDMNQAFRQAKDKNRRNGYEGDLFDIAERIAIKGKGYPSEWPWLVGSSIISTADKLTLI